MIVESGSPPDIIAKTASRLDNDLIVVGTARHNNISDFFLDSAFDHLVRYAHAPVLVVKERPRSNYQNIMLATDFSGFSRRALTTAMF
ncbi:universal stress protein [Parasphingorhabdus sp.]|uniref:universal stress protein n=1 Tax=Parasphingorhabdus sp. TaxID=2709688 RepID=UPI0035945345